MTLPVSVIIPVRDSRFFHEALASAIAEDVQQIIVICDGAFGWAEENDAEENDGFRALLAWPDQLAERNRNDHFISTPPRGVGRARNDALKEADQPYIALLDADDVWMPGKTQKQLDALEAWPHRRTFTSSLVDQFVSVGFERPATLREDKLGVISLFFPSNLLCHREVFERVGGFDPNLVCANDVDWYRRALGLGIERVHTNEVLVRKRVHDENLSLCQGHDMQRQIFEVLKRKPELGMFPIW